MYAEHGEVLSEQEVLIAARNWVGLCEKIERLSSEDKTLSFASQN